MSCGSVELDLEVESWIDDLDQRRYAVALPHPSKPSATFYGFRRPDRLVTVCSNFDSIWTALSGE